MTGPVAGTARLLSGNGRSAIAIIQIQGDLSQLDTAPVPFRAANQKPVTGLDLDAICFGTWGDPGEEVVVCRTAPSALEVTCHGGVAAVSRILKDLAERGFDEPSPTPPGLEEAKASLLSLLTQTRTQHTAEILLDQISGTWDRSLVRLKALPLEDRRQAIEAALRWQEFGRHLTQPWNVVLCGRPNVGKSSLMNALAGFTRSIVSEIAGTTRDRVTLDTAIDGWPMRIIDTAGIRETSDQIERQGVAQAHTAIREADLSIIILDQTSALHPADVQLLSIPCHRRMIVAHKADLPPAESFSAPPGSLSVSSINGHGISPLLEAIARALVPHIPSDEQALAVTPTQVAELERLLT